MRLAPLSLLALGALLVSCGGSGSSSADIPADPLDALEAGMKAQNNAEYALAAEAFRQVADDTSASKELRFKALIGLGSSLLPINDTKGAQAAFDRARNDHPELYDIKACQDIIDAYIKVRDQVDAERELKLAFEQFPDQAAALDKQKREIEGMLSGDESVLDELGYTGD